MVHQQICRWSMSRGPRMHRWHTSTMQEGAHALNLLRHMQRQRYCRRWQCFYNCLSCIWLYLYTRARFMQKPGNLRRVNAERRGHTSSHSGCFKNQDFQRHFENALHASWLFETTASCCESNAHTPHWMREGYKAYLKPFDDKTFSCRLQRFKCMLPEDSVTVILGLNFIAKSKEAHTWDDQVESPLILDKERISKLKLFQNKYTHTFQ